MTAGQKIQVGGRVPTTGHSGWSYTQQELKNFLTLWGYTTLSKTLWKHYKKNQTIVFSHKLARGMWIPDGAVYFEKKHTWDISRLTIDQRTIGCFKTYYLIGGRATFGATPVSLKHTPKRSERNYQTETRLLAQAGCVYCRTQVCGAMLSKWVLCGEAINTSVQYCTVRSITVLQWILLNLQLRVVMSSSVHSLFQNIQIICV